METTVKFTSVNVDNSITNPNSTTPLDLNTPFTFTQFLKNANNLYSPTAYNDLYVQYIRSWYNSKNDIIASEEEFVQKQYIELLKEITITYSTDDERRYFQNIDFNDPEDLEVIIPFYARKIKEIVFFYKDRRDKLKFVVEQNKRKTTEFSIERAAKQTIIDYLFDSNTGAVLGIDVDSIIDTLQIDVEELVDTFGAYLDLSNPPPSYGNSEREQFFTSNLNEINGEDLLDLGESLRKNLFNNVFLKELGVAFTINVNLNYDPICTPNNPIGKFIQDKTVNGVAPNTKDQLYQQLLEKYIGVDFYYIQKNTNGEVLSGKLLTASNPSGNLVNIRNASTATVPSNQLLALKKLGLFFNEDNSGILRFNSTSFTYEVDPDNVQPGETYVYPDPAIYGTVSKPIVFNINNTINIKNITSGFAYGDIKVDPKDQSFYAYFSNEQAFETENINTVGLIDKFTQLYNVGYAYDWKEDVYGNEYGIFKDTLGQYHHGKLTLEDITGDNYFVKLLVFNGWLFTDFDPLSSEEVYNTSGPYVGLNDVYMSGLSTDGGTFTGTETPYYLNFRNFIPYQDIPSAYDLYPILNDQRVLLDTQVLPQNKTVVSTTTGTDLYQNVNSKFELQGKLFVKNAVTNSILPISSTLSATYVKYPAAVQTEIYNNIKGFELHYNTLVLYTSSYIVIDRISYSENGFESPNTYNVYVSGNTPLNKISNTFFIPKVNELFFFVTTVSGNSNSSYKLIVPTIYSYNINSSKLTKLYPLPSTPTSELQSNFSFLGFANTTFGVTPVNIVEVATPKLAYNSYNDMFVVSFIGKDANKSPYLFDYKFKYKNKEINVGSANLYDVNSTGVQKSTVNLYQTYTYSNLYDNLISIPSTGVPSIPNTNNLDITFNSTLNTAVTVNLTSGFISI